MSDKIKLEIVSAEEELFSDKDKVLVDISCDKILNILNQINTQ